MKKQGKSSNTIWDKTDALDKFMAGFAITILVAIIGFIIFAFCNI